MSKSKNDLTESSKATTEDSGTETRRKVLKSALVGGGAVGAGTQLPATWTKPIADSLTLPAHGATSGAPMDITTIWVGDSTWFNGTVDEPLDGTPFFNFSSGVNDLDVSVTTDTSHDLSLFVVNVGLSQAPGSPGTANLRVRSNSVGDVDLDSSYDSSQTDINFSFDGSGTTPVIDPPSGDVDITVTVPGFETVRVNIDIDAD